MPLLFIAMQKSKTPLSIAERGFLRCLADRFMKNNGIISLQYSDYQYYLEIILSRSFHYFLRFVGKMQESYMLICNFAVLGQPAFPGFWISMTDVLLFGRRVGWADILRRYLTFIFSMQTWRFETIRRRYGNGDVHL